MNGRIRSSNRAHHKLPVVAATAIVASAIVVAVVGVFSTVDGLRLVYARYAGLDHTAREQAAGLHEGFAPDDWEFLARHLQRGDRFLLVTPAGGARGEANLGFVTRAYAGYFLLPAIQVASREDATMVVYVGSPAPPNAVCSDGSVCILRLRR